jgi:AraC family transcriptional regulator of adaptative response/methylated-DNA-[protein]-cysteine methyltransferase
MNTHTLPRRDEMMEAFLSRDPAYEGVFVTAVRTTGIFCRTACTARKPNPENVEFYGSCQEALLAGYRPCKRCRPLRPMSEAPVWLTPVLEAVEVDPTRRWRDQDLRDLGVDPARARRWFQSHHGMTFHGYSRARRLASALGQIQSGESVTRSAFAAGYDSVSGFSEAFRKLAGAPPTEVKDAPVVHATRIPTPLGPMVAAATLDALLLLEFADRRMLPTQFRRLQRSLGCVFAPGDAPVFAAVRAQLDEYFAGRRTSFDVSLDVPGTDFQRRVWKELRAIPAGETRSYADIARLIGRPTAVRAVARANGDNRLAILIPCHRVVGSDGSLTGYGGGVWRKKRLLELERGAVQ